jgi:hypothetical protein
MYMCECSFYIKVYFLSLNLWKLDYFVKRYSRIASFIAFNYKINEGLHCILSRHMSPEDMPTLDIDTSFFSKHALLACFTSSVRTDTSF